MNLEKEGSFMEEILRDLVDVIETASIKTSWDYLIVIVPIVISFFAVIVSVRTSMRQNKIALFEKRYEVVYLLGFIVSVCENAIKHKDIDKAIPLEYGMTTFYLLEGMGESDEKCSYTHFYASIVLKLSKLECLFKSVNSKPILTFLSAFNEYSLKVHKEEANDSDLQKLEEMLLQINKKKIMRKLNRYIKL